MRVPNNLGQREERIAEFPTTVRGLLALRDWLAGFDVDQVVMEATGVHWKAPWAILEDELKCLLVNARHVKQFRAARTAVSDAAWLCRLAEAGLLRFCPVFCVWSVVTRPRTSRLARRRGMWYRSWSLREGVVRLSVDRI